MIDIAIQGGVLGIPKRGNLSINISNPIAGIDLLLHGGRSRGWGQPGFPDPTLLLVRGFDPVMKRFKYDVNPEFGSARSPRTVVRIPFRITLGMQLPIGPTWSEQTIDDQLAPGRWRPGAKKSKEEIKSRLAAVIPNPLGQLGRGRDSLFLSPQQIAELVVVLDRYATVTDSALDLVAEHIAAIGDRPTEREKLDALAHSKTAFDIVEAAMMMRARRVRIILTEEQIGKLSGFAATFLDEALIKRDRAMGGFVF